MHGFESQSILLLDIAQRNTLNFYLANILTIHNQNFQTNIVQSFSWLSVGWLSVEPNLVILMPNIIFLRSQLKDQQIFHWLLIIYIFSANFQQQTFSTNNCWSGCLYFPNFFQSPIKFISSVLTQNYNLLLENYICPITIDFPSRNLYLPCQTRI